MMPTAPQRATPPHAARTMQWSRTEQAGRKWYSRKPWLTMRQAHLVDNPACVECLKEGKPMAQAIPSRPHVDHIRPHRGQWQLFLNKYNLQTLCDRHHSEKTRREQMGTGGSATCSETMR